MGGLLQSVSSPTDAKPTGSVIVEAHYAMMINTTTVLIVLGCIIGAIILFVIIAGAIVVSVSTIYYM